MSVQQPFTQSDSIAAPAKHLAQSCVLTLVGTYLPGFKAGGPIRSIANLVAALGEEFTFRIVTLDRDLGDKAPYPGVVVNQWMRVGQADVQYLQPGLRGFLRLWTLLRSVDEQTVLYLNSFFRRRFSMLPIFMCWLRLCRPRRLILAPRGEFSLGALGIKRIRKLLYLRMSKGLTIYQKIIWQASSDFEASDIRRQFQTRSVVIRASDIAGAVPPRSGSKRDKRAGELRVVFVGRCSRMKNLSGALRLLAGVSGEISFDLYGSMEDAEYWRECQGIIAALPPNIQVKHHGVIGHNEVGLVFAEHDLFLFPTLGENFGHVIAEALIAGCPVLISDQTPWRNLEAEGVGWDIPLAEAERFRSALQQCVDGDSGWLAAMSSRARSYGARRSLDPDTIEANRRLLQLARGTVRQDSGS